MANSFSLLTAYIFYHVYNNIFWDEKSRNHASSACGQFVQKLWTFLYQQQIFGSFYSSIAKSVHYLYTINLFFLKNITNALKKKSI